MKNNTQRNKGRSTPKRRALKALAITLIVILTLGLIVGVLAVINVVGTKSLVELGQSFDKISYEKQLTPVLDKDGYWSFTTDGDFKIIQFTDVHIGGGFMSQKKDAWALNAVAAMITAEKPDLVVITGDIAYPVPFQAGTFNNLNPTKVFAEMMEKLGAYWTFAYGNHDTEAYSYYSREEMNDWYKEQGFKYCLYQEGACGDDLGYGNNIIKVKNSLGIVTQAVTLLDSHSYTDGDYFGVEWKYDNLHQSQVDWYSSAIAKINEDNAKLDANAPKVKSMAFFHIPLREYRTAWAEYQNNGNEDTADTQYVYGNMGESNKENSVGEMTYGVYCGVSDDSFFEVGAANGLQAIFCGHDHYNNFSVIYKGVRLTYGMSVDYLAYSGIWQEKSQRGCTIIDVHTDGSFDCMQSNYYQDKYKSDNKQ